MKRTFLTPATPLGRELPRLPIGCDRMHPDSPVNPKYRENPKMKAPFGLLLIVILIASSVVAQAASQPSKTPGPFKKKGDHDNQQSTQNESSGSGDKKSKGEGDKSTPKDTPVPRKHGISVGNLNKKVLSMPKLAMPEKAKAAGASGPVQMRLEVDENGRVTSAKPLSGHPLLQQEAVSAAKKYKFKPTLLSGVPVKVSGIIVYNFQ
jgi:TonB family protein